MGPAGFVLVAWFVCAPFLAFFIADAIRIADQRRPVLPAEAGATS